MPTVFRICKTKYAAGAFDGEGAFRFGGRWNSRGVRMIYTAGSLALATLEIVVNLDGGELLSGYSYIAVQIPSALILPILEFRKLPRNWNRSPAPPSLARIGDDWIRSQASAVLEVPTSIVPEEQNYLVNPAHPDFALIRREKPRKFVFDKRLKAPR